MGDKEFECLSSQIFTERQMSLNLGLPTRMELYTIPEDKVFIEEEALNQILSGKTNSSNQQIFTLEDLPKELLEECDLGSFSQRGSGSGKPSLSKSG